MHPDLTFRTATTADAASLVELVESAYRGDASRIGWTTEADLLDGQRLDPEMAHDLLTGTGIVLLAEEHGRLVACVHLGDEGDGVAHFGLFAVAPDQQGRGVGVAVIDEAIEECRRRWNARRVRMTVIRQRDDLIAFYERHGFVRTGKTEPFPYGDTRFGIPKRDDLEFVELVRDSPQ